MLNVFWVQAPEFEQTFITVERVLPAVFRICICCWS